MAVSSRKIRLPELPIFRKYSLALRQEFARPEELLLALEETRRQVEEARGQMPPAEDADLISVRSPSAARRTPGPFGSVRGRGAQTEEEADEEEDDPESFLKDSVRGPAAGPEARLEKPSGPDETKAMPALEKEASRVPPRRTKPPAFPAIKYRDAPGSGPAAAPEGEVGGKEKKRPDPGIASSKSTEPAPDDAEPGSAPQELKGVTRIEPVKKAVPADLEETGRPKTETPEAGRPAPQDEAGPDAASAADVEREFWGDERSGKGRKGRARSQKGRSPGIGIVRVGAEGRPEAKGDRLPEKGA